MSRYFQSWFYVTAFTVTLPCFCVLFYLWVCNMQEKTVKVKTRTCLHERNWLEAEQLVKLYKPSLAVC